MGIIKRECDITFPKLKEGESMSPAAEFAKSVANNLSGMFNDLGIDSSVEVITDIVNPEKKSASYSYICDVVADGKTLLRITGRSTNSSNSVVFIYGKKDDGTYLIDVHAGVSAGIHTGLSSAHYTITLVTNQYAYAVIIGNLAKEGISSDTFACFFVTNGYNLANQNSEIAFAVGASPEHTEPVKISEEFCNQDEESFDVSFLYSTGMSGDRCAVCDLYSTDCNHAVRGLKGTYRYVYGLIEDKNRQSYYGFGRYIMPY